MRRDVGIKVMRMDVKGEEETQSTNEEVERIDGGRLGAKRPDCGCGSR